MIKFEKCAEAISLNLTARFEGQVVNNFRIVSVSERAKGFAFEGDPKGLPKGYFEVNAIEMATLLKGKTIQRRVKQGNVVVSLERLTPQSEEQPEAVAETGNVEVDEEKAKAFARVQKKVDKLNKFIADQIEACHGYNELYLDDSSTIEGTPEEIAPTYKVDENGHLLSHDEEDLCAALEYDDETGEWNETLDLPEMLNWIKLCVRKGVKYFKASPEVLDDDEARRAYMEELDD